MRLSTTVRVDERLIEACKPFDYAFSGESITEIPDVHLPDRDGSWSVGLIVGASGSGKTTLLSNKYGTGDKFSWDPYMAVVSQVPAEKLMAAGLNSVPAWCRPYHCLSTGEAFRADVAARLYSDASFDEFTSTVDRTVAASCSRAISRHIRKCSLTGIVLASCHRDIIPWLEPDWVADLDEGRVARSAGNFRRPSISIRVEHADRSWWEMFRRHHYLSAKLNMSSKCFLARVDGIPVGFASALAFPNRNFKNAYRGHRTVVLPDYQGLGIGVRLSDFVADYFLLKGCRYFSKTAHPRMGEYRESSRYWSPTTKNKRSRRDYLLSSGTKEDGHKDKHYNRVCYSHERILGDRHIDELVALFKEESIG